MKKNCCLFLGLLFIFSCTTTQNVESPDKITLARNKVIYLNMPRDGRYKGTIYRGSAQTYQELLDIYLEDYSAKNILSKEYENLDDCLNTAKTNNADYLFYSTILHWEDRETAWSGIADTLTVNIEIIEIGTERKVYEAEMFGKGKNMTFSSGKPEDFLCCV